MCTNVYACAHTHACAHAYALVYAHIFTSVDKSSTQLSNRMEVVCMRTRMPATVMGKVSLPCIVRATGMGEISLGERMQTPNTRV